MLYLRAKIIVEIQYFSIFFKVGYISSVSKTRSILPVKKILIILKKQVSITSQFDLIMQANGSIVLCGSALWIFSILQIRQWKEKSVVNYTFLK